MQNHSSIRLDAFLSRRWLLPVGAGLLLFAAGIAWLARPQWIALDSPLSAHTRPEALSVLRSADIPWRHGADGNIEIPAERARAAQDLLAPLGLAFPEPAGFESLATDDYTMSDFARQLAWQRALEGELARTIMGIAEVRSARVHLTLPRPELFRSTRSTAKASVVLQLRPNETLSEASAQGIREIVASSVEGLRAEAVALLDDHGRPLGETVSRWQSVGADATARRLETDLERRIRGLLRTSWGIDDAWVSVRADLNFDRVTAVRDGAVPSDDAVGFLTREQVSDAAPSREGLPGASTATREYSHARERIETEFAGGRIERLSIAVSLPAAQAGADLRALESLVGAAIGLRAERGDQLVISLAPPVIVPVAPSKVSAGSANLATREAAATSKTSAADVPVEGPVGGNDATARWPLNRALALLLLAGLIALALLLALQRRNARHSGTDRGASRLAPAERERLLADLEHWVRQ